MNTQLFISRTFTPPSKETFKPATNPSMIMGKPASGGLWTSTYIEEEHTSGWVEWCEIEEFLDTKNCGWYLLDVKPEARIYTIDDPLYLQVLVQGFEDKNHYMKPLNFSSFSLLDFQKLARYMDGIYLTERGQHKTRWSNPSLYGWDCESTLWLNWVFENVRQIEPAKKRY